MRYKITELTITLSPDESLPRLERTTCTVEDEKLESATYGQDFTGKFLKPPSGAAAQALLFFLLKAAEWSTTNSGLASFDLKGRRPSLPCSLFDRLNRSTRKTWVEEFLGKKDCPVTIKDAIELIQEEAEGHEVLGARLKPDVLPASAIHVKQGGDQLQADSEAFEHLLQSLQQGWEQEHSRKGKSPSTAELELPVDVPVAVPPSVGASAGAAADPIALVEVAPEPCTEDSVARSSDMSQPRSGRRPSQSGLTPVDESPPPAEPKPGPVYAQRRAWGYVAAALLVGLLLVLVVTYVWKPFPSPSCQVDTAKLRTIRPIGGDCKAEAAGPRYPTIEGFFEDANGALLKHLDELFADFQKGKEHFGMTHVYGLPGSGKSMFFQHLTKRFPERRPYQVKLERISEKMPGKTRLVYDLKENGGSNLCPSSKLPAFGTASDNDDIQPAPEIPELLAAFGHHLEKTPPPFIFFDSIDEIHPLSAKALLDKLDDFIRNQQDAKGSRVSNFLHVFVVGRPEGFAEYYKDSHPKQMPGPWPLNPPVFRSKRDLQLAAEASRAYHRRQSRDVDAVMRLAEQHPFVGETAHILAYLGELIKDNASDYVKKGLSEREIKDALFSAMLGRNQASHHRPNTESQEYIHLLEDIASRYTHVSQDGYFSVQWSDEVECRFVKDGQMVTGKYNVIQVLSRSGVAYLEPVDLHNPKFRFVPSWLHEHLVYRRNQRVCKDQRYPKP